MDLSLNGLRPGRLEKDLQAKLAGMSRRIGEGDARRIANGLGWFSIGLGTLELGAPRLFAAVTGAGRTLGGRLVVRACGAREIAAGAGILAVSDPEPWLWGRVAGDAMDLGLLATALMTRRRARHGSRGRLRLALSTSAVLGVTMLDATVAARLAAASGRIDDDGSMHLHAAVTVNRPVDEVYGRWHHLETLPEALHHLRAVHPIDERRSHWVARGPFGRDIEWDAEIVSDVTNQRMEWRSTNEPQVENRGVVQFRRAPGDRGTEIVVELWYAPPGGIAGAAVATAVGEGAREQLRDDLYRFKQLVETGQVARSEAIPAGPAIRQLFRQRAARPAA